MKRKDIQKIVANANATLKIEGLKPSTFALNLARKQLTGKISRKDVTRLILEKYLG